MEVKELRETKAIVDSLPIVIEDVRGEPESERSYAELHQGG